MEFELEIKKLGLSDKETAVYLASLELGPAAVQPIAKKAKVARATTYLVLEALLQRGLVDRHKEGKKTLFQAEPPQKLLEFVTTEEQNLQKRRSDLEQIIPRLHALMHTIDDKPTVEYFDGIDGLRTMRQIMLRNSEFGDTWYSFTPIDVLTEIFGDEKESLYINQRRAKGIKSYAIVVSRSEKLKKRLMLESVKSPSNNRKFVSPSDFKGVSAITVYGNSVSVGKLEGKLGGMIIDSPQMAQFLREVLIFLWKSLP